MIRGKTIIITFFLFASAPLAAQLDIYYDIDQYVLKGNQEELIQNFIDTALDVSQPYQVFIRGFADESGSRSSNLLLSQRRADRVSQFLESHYPEMIDSIAFLGMGEVESTIEERKYHRKVNIEFKKTKLAEEETTILPYGEPVAGTTFELKNINFKLSKPILLKESYSHLKHLFLWLKKYPNVVIEVQGHVCCSNEYDVKAEEAGIRTYGMILSKERAKAICDILIKSGIDPKRLNYKGFGFTKPKFFPEKTNEHRKGNRRVEIKILQT